MEFFAIFCLIEVSRLPESGTQANRWDEMGRIPPPRPCGAMARAVP